MIRLPDASKTGAFNPGPKLENTTSPEAIATSVLMAATIKIIQIFMARLLGRNPLMSSTRNKTDFMYLAYGPRLICIIKVDHGKDETFVAYSCTVHTPQSSIGSIDV